MFLALNLLSLLIISLVSILCFMLLIHGRGDKPLQFFRYLLIIIVLWLFSNYALKIFNNHAILLFWLKTTFATSAVILYFLYRFSQEFPNELQPKSKVMGWLTVLATISVIILSYTNTLVGNFTVSDSLVLAIYGSTFYLFLIYVLLMFVLILRLLWNQYKISSLIKKQQSKFLFIGFILSMIFISSIDLIIPLLIHSNTSANFGPYGIIFLVIFAYIALTKHHLFETKVIISEFWATFLLVSIFAWLVIHFSIGNLIGFLFIFAMGILFIKSVISESTKENKLVEANCKLEEDKEKLVQLDKMKDEFLQMATHELNTPISVIQGKLSMIMDEDMGGFGPEQKKFLGSVSENSKRLAQMARDLLSVERIDQNRVMVTLDEVDLTEMVSKIVADLVPRAKLKNDILTLETPEEPLPKIMIDQNKIAEVFNNLIVNATKFTENGTIKVKVELKDDQILVSISDTGIGIDKDGQTHLFEKFHQVGRFAPQNPIEQQGTGLGLYISKKLIELHHGKIWLESEAGHGTTFYFTLPVKQNKQKEEAKNG